MKNHTAIKHGMLPDFKEYLQIPTEDILAIKQYKVNRTKERIARAGRG